MKINKSALYFLMILFVFCFYTVGTASSAPVAKRQSNLRPVAFFKGAIRLEPGKAIEFATRKKVAYLAVGAEKIADAVPVDSAKIRILGLQTGATNLVVGYDDNSADEYEILVNKGFKVEVINGIITNPAASLVGW
ncbi:MAG: pilus assembly protein N-terminal domain-containing protein [Desulfosarcina sp.]|nr:pilus assembly protein N-terminal domain-containing protein [Desulfobacterales bacterium]